jgi:serine-type D-Ala-D-Ala carboxypeptidase (penicillin-binding protein 5/6)
MARSPFIEPGRSPRRRRRRGRPARSSPRSAPRPRSPRGGPGRGGRGILAAGAALLALALAALVLLDPFSGGSTHESAAASHRHRRRTTARAAGTAILAASGYPLGKPQLPLRPTAASADPMHLGFAHPPRAGIVVDLDSGAVLWQMHPQRRLRIASLTKMMTALIAAKNTTPASRILITKQAEDMPGSKVGLLPLNKRVDVEPVLYGLLLPSGNDAAVALAQHVAGTVPRFVQEMNEEAARLGLGCTRYSSPSGYYDAGNFSCAADLAELAHDDLAQPRIAKVAATGEAVLRFPIKGGKLFLTNNNPLLLYGYPGTTGLKTGWTEAAGPCLVATAQRDGVRLAVVLLGSQAPGTQAAELLDAAFDHVYHLRPVPHPPIAAGV